MHTLTHFYVVIVTFSNIHLNNYALNGVAI